MWRNSTWWARRGNPELSSSWSSSFHARTYRRSLRSLLGTIRERTAWCAVSARPGGIREKAIDRGCRRLRLDPRREVSRPVIGKAALNRGYWVLIYEGPSQAEPL